MKEQELLYHFPYKIDKENNFRHFANDDNRFIQRFVPNYDGTNVHEFLINKSGLSEQQINEFSYIYENYRNWIDWFKYGKNIFSFSTDLLSLLDKTDVSDVTPDKFHLPYDIFYLSLKPLNIKISKNRDEIIEGVYIDHNIWNASGEHPEGYCDLSFYFVGDFKSIFLDFIPKVKSRSIYTINNVEKYDEYPIGSFWNIWLWFQKSEGRVNVKQAIDYYLEGLKDEIFPKSNSENAVTDIELDFYNYTTQLLTNTLNLVINCILYLSQPTEKIDIEKRYPIGLPSNLDKKISFAKTQKELKKLDEKIEHLGFTKINYVGQSFKNVYENVVGNSSVRPHWRRGHWRNQKHGENYSLSKLIWIMPTIVNNAVGEPEKGHIYDIPNDNKTANRVDG